MDSQQVLENVLAIVRGQCDNPGASTIDPNTRIYERPLLFTDEDVIFILRELLRTYDYIRNPLADCRSESLKKIRRQFATPSSITDWVITQSLILEPVPL